MTYIIRHPDGSEFGPYTVEELRELSAKKAYPPNTEILANGEWVSLGGWLVVRRRVEQLQADEASRPQAAPVPPAAVPPGAASPGPHPSQSQKAIFIGVGLFLVVISLALFLR